MRGKPDPSEHFRALAVIQEFRRDSEVAYRDIHIRIAHQLAYRGSHASSSNTVLQHHDQSSIAGQRQQRRWGRCHPTGVDDQHADALVSETLRSGVMS